MNITRAVGRDMLCGLAPDWYEIKRTRTGFCGNVPVYEGIFQHYPTGKFYRLEWYGNMDTFCSYGHTPFTYAKPEPIEVSPINFQKVS